MKKIKDLLDGKEIHRSKVSSQWQEHALRFAEKLGIKVNGSWFKFFKNAYKKNQEGLLESTYTAIIDIPKNNPEKYFYKVFWNLVKKKS